MPAGYPDYPNHRQLHAYFEDYARHFGVYAYIRFGHTVQAVTPCEPSLGAWPISIPRALQEHAGHFHPQQRSRVKPIAL